MGLGWVGVGVGLGLRLRWVGLGWVGLGWVGLGSVLGWGSLGRLGYMIFANSARHNYKGVLKYNRRLGLLLLGCIISG